MYTGIASFAPRSAAEEDEKNKNTSPGQKHKHAAKKPRENGRLFKNALRRYGIAHEILSDERDELLDALNIRHARRSATEKDVAIPTQYLEHRDGVVRWFYRDESIRLRPHPRKALAAIRESLSIPLTK